MEITNIRIRLVNRSADRLKAYGSITFDEEFVIRDIKIVDGSNGLFVAMPSRKVTLSCPRCAHRNHLRARFCNDCGGRLPPPRLESSENHPTTRMHRDIAHPITTAFREIVQGRVIEAYLEESERAKDPDYEPNSMDAEIDTETETTTEIVEEPVPVRSRPHPAAVRTPTAAREPSAGPYNGVVDFSGGGQPVGPDMIEVESDIERDGSVSEYDELIAGLNRGGESAPSSKPAPSRPTDPRRRSPSPGVPMARPQTTPHRTDTRTAPPVKPRGGPDGRGTGRAPVPPVRREPLRNEAPPTPAPRSVVTPARPPMHHETTPQRREPARPSSFPNLKVAAASETHMAAITEKTTNIPTVPEPADGDQPFGAGVL